MPRRACACERLPVGVREHPCARPHAPPHCRARALAARGREHAGSRPRQWPSAVGVLGIVRSTPARARTLRVAVASAPHVPFQYPAQIAPRTGPGVPREYPPSTLRVVTKTDHAPTTVRVPCPRRGGPRAPAPLPSAHDCRPPVSPFRVLSVPAARRRSTLSAPPCRACRGTCVLAQCASRGRVCEHRARAPATAVRVPSQHGSVRGSR
jgi:hypothetical protein